MTMTRHSEQLEHEAEQARLELSASLDELRSRLTPREIVEETMEYARDTPVGQFVRNVSRDVQANPIPLILVVAAVAWASIAAAIRSNAATNEKLRPTSASDLVPEHLDVSVASVAEGSWEVERIPEPVE
jgi:uncharacterized protein DUF3618